MYCTWTLSAAYGRGHYPNRNHKYAARAVRQSITTQKYVLLTNSAEMDFQAHFVEHGGFGGEGAVGLIG